MVMGQNMNQWCLHSKDFSNSNMAATPTAQGQDANATMGGVHDWVCTLGKNPTKAHHNATMGGCLRA